MPRIFRSPEKNTFAFPAIAFVLIMGLLLVFAPNFRWEVERDDTPYGADFLQEWIGASMILHQKSATLYDVKEFQAWQHNAALTGFHWKESSYFPPVYPPVHYLLFTPLAAIPYRAAVIVWLAILVGAALASAHMITWIAKHHARDSEISELSIRKITLAIWLAILFFPSLMFSEALCQKSIIWLLLTCTAFRLFQTQREFAAGAVFGILSIKPTLFFLLPLAMLRDRQWKFFAGASTTVIVLWGSAILLIPFDAWSGFLAGLSKTGNYAAENGYRLDWSCNLMTLAHSLTTDFIPWGKVAICLPLGIYVLWGAIENRQHSIHSPEKWLSVLSATFLLSPHAYSYDLCLFLLPIFWVAYQHPRLALIYYAALVVAVTVSQQVQTLFHIPVIPLLLIGIVCELRLRGLVVSPYYKPAHQQLPQIS